MTFNLYTLNLLLFALMAFAASMLQRQNLLMKGSFILLTLGLLAGAFVNARNGTIELRFPKSFLKYLSLYFLFFLLLYITTIIHHSNNLFANDFIRSTLLNSLILIASFFIASKLEQKHFKALAFIVFTGFLVESVYVFITYVPGSNVRHPGFGGILQLAQDTGFVLSMLIAYIMHKKHFKLKVGWFIYGLLFIFAYALYATASRGPIIGLLISAFAMFLTLNPTFSLGRIFKFLVAAFTLLVVLYFTNARMRLNIDTILDPFNDASNSSKILANMISLKMIQDNPFFGAGLGSFKELKLTLISSFNIQSKIIYEMSVPHNMFLGIFAEAGLFVFLLFCYIVIQPIFVYKRLFLTSPNQSLSFIYLGLMGFIVVYNVDAFFHNYYTQNFIWVIIGFGYGLAANKTLNH